MSVTTYESRRNKILQSVINEHVQTGRPVSSESVAKQLKKVLSSATVRNYMKYLEKEGMLSQPHTSAGRIPTDKGYRLYIDTLMQARMFTQKEAQKIEEELKTNINRLEDTIKTASKILSQITNQIAIVLPPRIKRSAFKRIELFLIGKKKLLIVLVTASGLIKESIVNIYEEVNFEDLQKISRFLNLECCDMALDEISGFLNRKLLEEKSILYRLLKIASDIISSNSLINDDNRIYVDGRNFLFEQPEFRDAQKLRFLLKALEAENQLVKILDEDLDILGVKVRIGKENVYENLWDFSFITSSYKIGMRHIGALGVLGPKRMEYPRIIAAVNHIAEKIGEIFERQST